MPPRVPSWGCQIGSCLSVCVCHQLLLQCQLLLLQLWMDWNETKQELSSEHFPLIFQNFLYFIYTYLNSGNLHQFLNSLIQNMHVVLHGFNWNFKVNSTHPGHPLSNLSMIFLTFDKLHKSFSYIKFANDRSFLEYYSSISFAWVGMRACH